MYRHKVVQGLAALIEKYGSGGKDPIMAAVWFGIKGQVPSFLASLDDNEQAVAEIHQSIMEALDIKAPPGYKWDIQGVSIKLVPDVKEVVIVPAEESLAIEVKPVKKKPKARKKKKPTPVAEVEAVVEPAKEGKDRLEYYRKGREPPVEPTEESSGQEN